MSDRTPDAERLIRERERAEDEQAHLNGDLCGNPDCSDCWPYNPAENDSEDRLIEWARGEYR